MASTNQMSQEDDTDLLVQHIPTGKMERERERDESERFDPTEYRLTFIGLIGVQICHRTVLSIMNVSVGYQLLATSQILERKGFLQYTEHCNILDHFHSPQNRISHEIVDYSFSSSLWFSFGRF